MSTCQLQISWTRTAQIYLELRFCVELRRKSHGIAPYPSIQCTGLCCTTICWSFFVLCLPVLRLHSIMKHRQYTIGIRFPSPVVLKSSNCCRFGECTSFNVCCRILQLQSCNIVLVLSSLHCSSNLKVVKCSYMPEVHNQYTPVYYTVLCFCRFPIIWYWLEAKMCLKLPGVPPEPFWTTALQYKHRQTFCWSRWQHGMKNLKLFHFVVGKNWLVLPTCVGIFVPIKINKIDDCNWQIRHCWLLL